MPAWLKALARSSGPKGSASRLANWSGRVIDLLRVDTFVEIDYGDRNVGKVREFGVVITADSAEGQPDDGGQYQRGREHEEHQVAIAKGCV